MASVDLEDALNNTGFNERRNLSEMKLKSLSNEYNFTLTEIEYLKKK